MKEVSGAAAILIDPTSEEKLEKVISEVLEDKKMRDNLIEKGKNHVKKFTWEKTAEETLKVYQSIL